jgi:hypothetical protein
MFHPSGQWQKPCSLGFCFSGRNLTLKMKQKFNFGRQAGSIQNGTARASRDFSRFGSLLLIP